MNERIIFSDFISSFANRQKGDKQSIERLLTLLFELIEKNLMVDKIVKVRHIGVFKLEWFEQRKITNVNTGEISEIGGYYRLAFTPDKEMAAAVNENYSHLQAVSLTNGLEAVSEKEEEILDAVVNEVKEAKTGTTEKNFVPLHEIKEELQDARSIMQEIAAMNEEQSVASEAAEMDLLEQLYQNETKTMFSNRYSQLIADMSQKKDSADDIAAKSVANEDRTTSFRTEIEPTMDIANNEMIANKEIENEMLVDEKAKDISVKSEVEKPEFVDSIDAVLAEADSFRSMLFAETSVAINEQSDNESWAEDKEEEVIVVIHEVNHEEPLNNTATDTVDEVKASTPLIEEIIHEPLPRSTQSTEESTPTIDNGEPKEAETQDETSIAQPKEEEVDRGGKGAKPQYTKWSIAGIVFTILLIIATFGYIYSGYFNRGKVGQKDIFEQTYEYFVKLFETKSVEIEQNDMTLSRKDTTQNHSRQVQTEKSKTNTPSQPKKESTVQEGVIPTPNTSPAQTTNDKVVKVDFAETLSSIARREYGSRFFWCYIYEANKTKIPNINNLRSGIQLIIPNKERLRIDPNNEVSLNQAKEKCQAIEDEHKRKNK